jgi:hypothetical protein
MKNRPGRRRHLHLVKLLTREPEYTLGRSLLMFGMNINDEMHLKEVY